MGNIPRLIDVNGKKVLFVDEKPFYMVSGEIHNSSSSSIEFLEPILEKLEKMNLNSVLLPVTWQMLEPVQGQFEFELVDQIIRHAEAHNLKLGILWFGTWKNAQCSYCPQWVKNNSQVHFRAQLEKCKPFIKRKSGLIKLPYSTISPFCEETMKADGEAFYQLMKHIKEVDINHTVITVQVENETGFLGGDMDYCDISMAKYGENVPEELLQYMRQHTEGMDPRVKKQLDKNKSGIWETVFEDLAHEIFIAYYTAKYVNYVAERGKEGYDLPMSVNCWLDGKGAKAGKYPCGGPIAKVMEVWKYAAPAIDIFAPDNYLKEYYDMLDKFTKHGNPIYVPESKPRSFMMGRQLYIIGHYHGLCAATFGVEDIGTDGKFDLSVFAPLIGFAVDSSKSYPQDIDELTTMNRLLKGAIEPITANYGTDNLQAFTRERNGRSVKVDMGDYRLKLMFIPKKQKDNCVLVNRLSEDEFLFIGYQVMINIESINKEKPYIQNISIEEGEYIDGKWKALRVLNGDEEMMTMISKPAMLKIKVNCYR